MTSINFCVICQLLLHFFNVKSFDILQSALPNRNPEAILEPRFDKITTYKIGDRFKYNCVVQNATKITTYTWSVTKVNKDQETINSSQNTSLLDITLDETYHKSVVQCDASALFETFTNYACVSTTLVLDEPGNPKTPPK
ncbi:uncharacterized protein [Epargyreus clarus]|uniref:uncharacterized protein n=1 Tax=Epargyreus clarus TaxID=520877 RepID=UPI003C2D8614